MGEILQDAAGAAAGAGQAIIGAIATKVFEYLPTIIKMLLVGFLSIFGLGWLPSYIGCIIGKLKRKLQGLIVFGLCKVKKALLALWRKIFGGSSGGGAACGIGDDEDTDDGDGCQIEPDTTTCTRGRSSAPNATPGSGAGGSTPGFSSGANFNSGSTSGGNSNSLVGVGFNLNNNLDDSNNLSALSSNSGVSPQKDHVFAEAFGPNLGRWSGQFQCSWPDLAKGLLKEQAKTVGPWPNPFVLEVGTIKSRPDPHQEAWNDALSDMNTEIRAFLSSVDRIGAEKARRAHSAQLKKAWEAVVDAVEDSEAASAIPQNLQDMVTEGRSILKEIKKNISKIINKG